MRSLRAAPAFTAIVVVTIATGIGVSTALFSVVHGIAFPRVPYPAPERLAVLGATINRQIQVATELLTPEQLQLWHDRAPQSLTSTSAFGYQQAVIENRAGNTIRVQGAVVDGSFFRLLNVQPRAGRIIGPADQVEPVVVISDTFWRTHLDADPDVLHHTLRLGTTVYSVIGVMPEGFAFPAHAAFWVPWPTASATQIPGAYLLVRLPENVTYDAAASEVAASYDAAWFADSARFGGMGVALAPFGERERRIPADTLPVVVAGVAILFLIALINLSVLFLARAARRGRELAIRTALGASPLRAAGPLASELLVLTSTGAVVGAAIASAGLRLARVYVPEYTTSATHWSDPRILGFLIAVTLFVTVVLALQPALRLRRFDVMASLGRGAAVATSTRRERRARNVLVAAQVTLALVLVTAGGIVAKSLVNLRTLDVGYDAERLVVAAPEYEFDKWDDARQRQLGELFLDRLTGRRDVASAAIWRLRMAAWPPPLQRELFGVEHRERQIVPEAYALHRYYEVSPGFFRTLGVRVAGRDFRETDRHGSEPVAIVMESAARAWFGGESPLGRRVRVGPPGSEWLTVVGVVPDLQLLSGLGRVTATRGRAAYLAWLVRPLAQAGDTPPVNWPRRQCLDCAAITMAARLPDRGANAHEVVRVMSAELRALAPELLVEPGRLLEQQMNWGTPAVLRRNARMLLAFSALALGLALLGLHGIVADAVNRRTAETGIRLALGARAPDVMRTIARESVSTAAAGVVVGVLIVGTATTLTKKLFFAGGHRAALAGTSAADARVLVPAAVAILLVACLTALIAARRATRLDPSVALRVE